METTIHTLQHFLKKLASLVGRAARWFRRDEAPAPMRGCTIDSLESRRFLSAAPALTGVELLGTAKSVTTVVLTFDQSLDPTTAQDLKAFALGKPTKQSSGDDGVSIGDFLPFSEHGGVVPAAAKAQEVKNGKIQFSSAVYDETTHSITLAPVAPFKATKFFKALRVRGSGAHAIKSIDDSPFNTGRDKVLHWKQRAGKVIHYVDGEHNRVTLKLTGHGKLYVFLRKGAETNPIIFVDSANPASTLIGSVKFAKGQSGPAIIGELTGAEHVNNNLANNANFSIQAMPVD